MAQLLMQGTNFVNFMGRYVYIAAEHSLEVVPVTEREDPQAVIGSTLHKIVYPDNYAKFVNAGRQLENYYEHVGNPEVLQVQVRGEYAYVAAGEGGLRIYDIAQIDHKGFSERITTAPVSRFGQRFWVKTRHASAVAAPTTLGVDPARTRNPMNQEQPIHPLYAYLYVVDKHEGLVLVNAATLLDGDPLNNFLKRALTWNPNRCARRRKQHPHRGHTRLHHDREGARHRQHRRPDAAETGQGDSVQKTACRRRPVPLCLRRR
jgi:hypothetical protein